MTTLNLTDLEATMIKSFIQEGVDCIGADKIEELLEDNMSFMSADDLKANLGWTKQSIGGVMGSLSDKGMIADTGESPRGARCTDWYATDEAITWCAAQA